MTMMIQEKCIQCVLRPLSKITERWNDRTRRMVITVSVLGLIALQTMQYISWIPRYLAIFIPSCFFIGLMILAGLDANIHPVRFFRPMEICWFGTGICMLISGLTVDYNFLPNSLLWLIGWPVFYIVWSQKDRKLFFESVCNGVYISFAIFILLSKLIAPLENLGYFSFLKNANTLMIYCLAVSLCAFSDVFSITNKASRRILGVVIAGFAFGVTIFTTSRSGLTCTGIALVGSIIVELLRNRQNFKKIVCTMVLPLIASILVFASMMTMLLGPFGKNSGVSLGGAMDYNESRFQDHNESLNSFTTGRVDIWKIYLKEVGLKGNPDSKVLLRPDQSVEIRYAHNALLQLAYENGIFTALFFFVFNLVSGIRTILYAWKHKKEPGSIFPFVVAVAYGAIYLVESVISPVYYLLCFLYFISQAYVFSDLKSEHAIES